MQDPSDPQSLNRYSYVLNNPVNLVDPSGYRWRGFFRAFFAAVAAIVATVLTGGRAELGAVVFVAIAGTAGAVAGDWVGAAIDRTSSADAPAATGSAPSTPPQPSRRHRPTASGRRSKILASPQRANSLAYSSGWPDKKVVSLMTSPTSRWVRPQPRSRSSWRSERIDSASSATGFRLSKARCFCYTL